MFSRYFEFLSNSIWPLLFGLPIQWFWSALILWPMTGALLAGIQAANEESHRLVPRRSPWVFFRPAFLQRLRPAKLLWTCVGGLVFWWLLSSGLMYVWIQAGWLGLLANLTFPFTFHGGFDLYHGSSKIQLYLGARNTDSLLRAIWDKFA